ncbi:MFS family permease [Rhizobium leguminosarum]|nr:MFS family permease [Rhizobium leguminosarum]
MHGDDRHRGNDCFNRNAADRCPTRTDQSLFLGFSSFLLTQTTTIVVFGKLADIYGRKPMVLVGIALFLFASVLAGFAWSMPSIIAFRLLQGIRAGAIQPVTMTVVADLFPGNQRGKVQGYTRAGDAAHFQYPEPAASQIAAFVKYTWKA